MPAPVANAASPIEHSNWTDRKTYIFSVTAALLAILIAAIIYDRHVDVVAWLLATVFILFLVAPSAEQAVKMLATVAALRSGVAFASSATVDDAQGSSTSAASATPGAAPPIGD